MFQHLIQPLAGLLQPAFSCLLCGIDQQQRHGLCHDCWQQLPWMEQPLITRQEQDIHAMLHYGFPVDRMIHYFKYEQQLAFQTVLSHCLLQAKLPRVQAIVPMPISEQRLLGRGYNQMQVIAELMAKQLRLPIWQPVLRSAQHAQKGLSRLERLENIEQQFRPLPSERKKYRRVLLIDDVVTTGSSLIAMKNALQRLGCQQVHCLCIAAAEL